MDYKTSDKSHWDAVWEKHDSKNAYNFEASRHVRALDKVSTFVSHGVSFHTNDTVLEAGCGDGMVLAKLMEHYDINGYGLDFSQNALDEAEKVLPKSAHLALGSVETLPYDNNFFDKIISLGVLEHFQNPEQTLNEMFRTLKVGGQVILMTPNKRSAGVADRRFKQLTKRWPFGYQTEYTTQQLSRLAREQGFSVQTTFTQIRKALPHESRSFKMISVLDQIGNAINHNIGFYSYVILTKEKVQ